MAEMKPVVIVGGGLNGLTMAVLLADLGLPCVLVERHDDTSIQYKFAGISPRSMEIFRALGLEQEIRAHKTGDQQGGGLARAPNLASAELQWSGAAWPDASPFSPTQPATCDQHVLEPILRRRALELGADVCFGTELVSFEQDEHGVRAQVRSRGDGAARVIEGSYLIGADGANGRVRDALGIGRSGAGVLQYWMNVIFATDLPSTLQGRRFTSCFVSDINGTFTPRLGGRWLLALQYSPDRGERPEDFDAARCRELVQRGAGRSDIRAELVDARAWQAAAYVADTFRSGRCFLIGDAAHLMPPTGAFGGNSGIHDAHNLAWKLAHVLRGRARESLLDSYDAERRPLIQATLGQALARLQRWFRDLGGRLPPPEPLVPDYDVVFGQRYPSGALLCDGPLDNAAFVAHDRLSAAPGTRAPHRPLEDGEQRSTLDLFGRRFVVLCAPNASWASAARALAERGFAVGALPLGTGQRSGDWPEAWGVGVDGAVLVRPDGFVAWRARGAPSDAERELRQALERLQLIALV
jgi:2-polyprenyl-6-methoxyphenol hydroxylase-like FAD-dependent oxidoreductase